VQSKISAADSHNGSQHLVSLGSGPVANFLVHYAGFASRLWMVGPLDRISQNTLLSSAFSSDPWLACQVLH